METLDVICSRKSIRSYTGEGLTKEEEDLIEKAAQASPIGMKEYDSVHITKITNKDLLEKIKLSAREVFNNSEANPLYDAPVFYIISSKIKENMENVNYSNAAIIVENMALEATNLGLGCCHIWGVISVINKKTELIKELNLPEGFIPCCGIIIGRTNEKYQERDIPNNRIEMNEIN